MKFSSKEGKSSNIERQFFPNKGKVIEKFMSIIKSNGKQEINFDVQKISMLDLSKLTHDFFVAIRIGFPKS